MPAWEKGEQDTPRARARPNLDRLQPWIDQGAKVLALNATCSMIMRREYPELLEGEGRARAKVLSEHIMDASEYLWSLRKKERLNTDISSSPGDTVSGHAPCHLRAQAVGFRGRYLMCKTPGVKTMMVMECCGHDGTWAMTVEGFDSSQEVRRTAFDGMKKVFAESCATDCPLAAIQFEQHAGVKSMHPMPVLARAYREDGFETEDK